MYKFDVNIFDEINSSEKAYWLGFIWCDGYICKRKRTTNHTGYEFKLSLAEQDLDHLIKFKEFLNSNHEIKHYKNGSSSFKKDAIECRLYICNKYFGQNLYNRYGLIPHRSSAKQLVSMIPIEYYKDFIRGIIDADGSLGSSYVYDNQAGKEVYKARLQISTYEDLTNFIQEYFYRNNLINNKSKTRKRHEDRDEFCEMLSYCGNQQIPRILNHLYEDATIYLERKYKIYQDILRETNCSL